MTIHHGPLASVLICSYNAEKFIGRTLTSVLDQTYRNLEILVLDNNSGDGTVEILREAQKADGRLRLFAGKENRGAYGGLNYLLERVNGEYVAIQDHDDIWHKEKMGAQISFLEQNGGYIGCGTAIVNHYEKMRVFLLRRQPTISTVAWHTSLVFRKVEKLYDVSLRVGNDYDFMRNALCGNRRRIYNLSEPYVLRRIRADQKNLSSSWISLRNLKSILQIKISIVDRLALLNRLILPHALVDYLLTRLLLRKNVVTLDEMKNDEVLREYVGGVVGEGSGG
jgi:glycosyltransferase involved in cell wall biosynthesis